jgi:tetratricopeptide (TPR) repeat protein
MSVLLDALKKAAAEKKKAMDTTVNSEMDVSDSNNASNVAISPALKLVTEDVAPVTATEEPITSANEVQSEVQADTSFKSTLNDMSTPTPNQDDLSLGNAEPSFEKDELRHDASSVTPAGLNDSEVQKVTTPAVDEAPETDKDSFEWSMNALPGYSSASIDDSAPIERNSILLTGALTSEPKAKKKSHSRWLLVLSVILMFIGISVYGLNYYQEQSEQLENSMRKYEFAKIQISLPKKKLPIAAAIDSGLPNSKDSSNELDSTSRVASTEVDQVSEVPSTSIEQMDAVVPVTQVEPTASVVKISNRGNKSKIGKSATNKNTVASTIKPVYQPVLIQVNKTEDTLSDAYSAYEIGNLGLSQLKFSEVLSFDPKNITAMIGLGGVAASSGQYYIAMDYYQQALSIDSNSLEVYEAIANLSPNIELNSEWNESLKNMAQIYPNSAALQYALGNLYASSSDWLAAQECYFNAYALDMNNLDFIVNLAISLDQLGKYPLAGQYYTQALALAGSNNVNFNVSDIKNRLVSIRQFMDQGK